MAYEHTCAEKRGCDWPKAAVSQVTSAFVCAARANRLSSRAPRGLADAVIRRKYRENERLLVAYRRSSCTFPSSLALTSELTSVAQGRGREVVLAVLVKTLVAHGKAHDPLEETLAETCDLCRSISLQF